MIFRYNKYPKEKLLNYVDAFYIKSFECCCPDMAFHIFAKYFLHYVGTNIEDHGGDWPIKIHVDSSPREALDLLFCPHCGERVILYLEDFKCETWEQWEDAIKKVFKKEKKKK